VILGLTYGERYSVDVYSVAVKENFRGAWDVQPPEAVRYYLQFKSFKNILKLMLKH